MRKWEEPVERYLKTISTESRDNSTVKAGEATQDKKSKDSPLVLENHSYIPNSELFTTALDFTANSKNPKLYADTRTERSKGRREISFEKSEAAGQVRLRTQVLGKSIKDDPKATYEVILPTANLDAVQRLRPQAIKTLLFLVGEIIDQGAYSINQAELLKNNVAFTAGDLVKAGYYTTPQGARKYLEETLKALQGFILRAEISISSGKSKQLRSYPTLQPFEDLTVAKNGRQIDYIITLGGSDKPDLWRIFFEYFTIFPTYAKSLGEKSILIMLAIYSHARMNRKKEGANYYVNISVGHLAEKAGLPGIEGNTSIKKTIIDPLTDAIEEIKQACSADAKNKGQDSELELELTLKGGGDPNKVEARVLYERGEYKITFKGEGARYFDSLTKKETKAIETAKSRAERQIDIATAAEAKERTRLSAKRKEKV